MTESLDIRFARAYKRRARAITAYGLISIIVGSGGLIDRSLLQASATAQVLDGWTLVAWLIVFVLGGLLAVVGIQLLRPDIEAAGDVLLMFFSLLNAVTIVAHRGFGGLVAASSAVLVAYVLQGRVGDLHSVSAFDAHRRPVPWPPALSPMSRRRRP